MFWWNGLAWRIIAVSTAGGLVFGLAVGYFPDGRIHGTSMRTRTSRASTMINRSFGLFTPFRRMERARSGPLRCPQNGR